MMQHSLCFHDTKLSSRELRGSPSASALKRGATPYQLVPKCVIWNDTKWHKCR